MIFLIYTNNDQENQTLAQQANDLSQKKYSFSERKRYGFALNMNKRGDTCTSNDHGRPLASLKANETLYVVGHGDKENPSLSGYTAKKIADILIDSGLPIEQKGLKIHLVCCHAGFKRNRFTPSFAEQLHAALREKRHPSTERFLDQCNADLSIKAPTCLISFDRWDGKAHVMGLAKYSLYQQKQSEGDNRWIENNKTRPSQDDYQYIGPGFKPYAN